MIDLNVIKKAHLKGENLSEINQMYKDGFSEITEEEQWQVWKMVCDFANFEMVDYLIEKGWRPAGVEHSGKNLLHMMASAEFGNSFTMPEGRVYETTKRLIANKVSPLKKESGGETALMLSARVGYSEMLRAHLEAGVKIDWTSNVGNTALHILAKESGSYFSGLVSAKEELEKDIQNESFNPNDSWHVECRAKREDNYKFYKTRCDDITAFTTLCLENGLDPDQKNNNNETPIELATRFRSKIVAAILKGADLSDEETAPLYIQAGGQDIFQACINKDIEAINALIKLGVNVNEEYDKERDEYHGMSPLSISVVQHDVEAIDLLINSGADPMLLGSKSWHPLRYLYVTRSDIHTNFERFKNKTFEKMLKIFITAGFEMDTLLDDEENTLLTISAKQSNRLQLYNGQSIAKVIIKETVFENADVNKTNRDGVSALMYLCNTDIHRAENELLFLLEQGANTDLKDKTGKTALIYATNNSTKSTAKTYCELLEQFGDIAIHAKDNSEKSALDYAAEKNDESLVAWLLERS